MLDVDVNVVRDDGSVNVSFTASDVDLTNRSHPNLPPAGDLMDMSGDFRIEVADFYSSPLWYEYGVADDVMLYGENGTALYPLANGFLFAVGRARIYKDDVELMNGTNLQGVVFYTQQLSNATYQQTQNCSTDEPYNYQATLDGYGNGCVGAPAPEELRVLVKTWPGSMLGPDENHEAGGFQSVWFSVVFRDIVDTSPPAQCLDGFWGLECEPCDPCGANETCIDGILGNGVCTCIENQWGPFCNNTCDCVNSTCADGRNGNGLCACPIGQYGADCSGVCDCNFGVCDDGNVGDGSCECDRNHWGVNCEILCDTCSGAGFCNQTTGECICDTGFLATSPNCTECESGRWGSICNGRCPTCENGDCDDGIDGSGECVCDDGWCGPTCAIDKTLFPCPEDPSLEEVIPPATGYLVVGSIAGGIGFTLIGVAALRGRAARRANDEEIRKLTQITDPTSPVVNPDDVDTDDEMSSVRDSEREKDIDFPEDPKPDAASEPSVKGE